MIITNHITIFGLLRTTSVFVVVIQFFILEKIYGIQWLGISKSNDSSICHIGYQQKWLTKTQSHLCIEFYPQLMYAAEKTKILCQDMFKNYRWNCSNINSAPDLTPDLNSGTREQAITYAIGSAAVIYTLSKGCAQGNIYNCPCVNKPPLPKTLQKNNDRKTNPLISQGKFVWSGCNNHIKWAVKVMKKFLDPPQRKIDNVNEAEFKKLLSVVNHHNNKIGRKHVERSLSTNCQCHGLSGSCSMRTCWQGLPNTFYDASITHRLMNQYRNAIEIPHLQSDFNNFKDDIIYFRKSPDYCTPDYRSGSQGTTGRYCNETSSMSQYSCNNMCCGRGYKSYIISKPERCNCKYYWCCYVKCKTCYVNVKINVCL